MDEYLQSETLVSLQTTTILVGIQCTGTQTMMYTVCMITYSVTVALCLRRIASRRVLSLWFCPCYLTVVMGLMTIWARPLTN